MSFLFISFYPWRKDTSALALLFSTYSSIQFYLYDTSRQGCFSLQYLFFGVNGHTVSHSVMPVNTVFPVMGFNRKYI